MSAPNAATVDTNADNMVTISSEAKVLFTDEARKPAFGSRAIARSMPSLREQRKTRRFCDVVFTAADGAEIWAHRFVLAARYTPCQALFAAHDEASSTEQADPGLQCVLPIRVVLNNMGRNMVELLVDYAYHVPLEECIGLENVMQALEVADEHNLPKIRDHSINMLFRNLASWSCIESFQLAKSRGYHFLAEQAFGFLVRNFDEVWKETAQFQSLTPDEMRAVLSDNRLYAPTEVVTFRAVLSWISADVAERKKYLAQFLPLLRFAQCTVMDFEIVVTDPQVQADEGSLEVLSVIHQTMTQPSTTVGVCAGVDLSPKTWLTPRNLKKALFVFGGWCGAPVNLMHTYNTRTRRWRALGSQATKRRAYHGAAVVLRSHIYFVGGRSKTEFYHSVVSFDVNRNTWSSKANMSVARCYVSVAVLQGSIYAMGGFDGRKRKRTVERYDPKLNQWFQVASMKDVRSDASAATARGRIYIAGGFTGRKILDTVESYDPSTNVWTRIATLSIPRVGLRAVCCGNMIYFIGGYNGFSRLASMEGFDITRARLTELPSMPKGKRGFAAVVLEGSIYTIGGYVRGLVSTVERYDIEKQRWYQVEEISQKCSGCAACVVSNVANPERWS